VRLAKPGRLVRLAEPPRPRGGGVATSQGHARTVFRPALAHGNLLVAEATAKEIGRLAPTEALELTLLIARTDPRRHPRVEEGEPEEQEDDVALAIDQGGVILYGEAGGGSSGTPGPRALHELRFFSRECPATRTAWAEGFQNEGSARTPLGGCLVLTGSAV
jgi:hypothetical protein